MPGIYVTPHTYNGIAGWHPHEHLLVTAGGVPLDAIAQQKRIGFKDETKIAGAWVDYDYFPEKELKSRSMAKLVKKLRAAHRSGKLRWDETHPMKSYKHWDKLLSEKVFPHGVHLDIRLDKKRNKVMTHRLEYALRYMGHPPVAIRTLVYNQCKGRVRYTPKSKSKGENENTSLRTIDLSTREFIERMAQHILGKGERQLFSYGLYAPRQINRARLVAKHYSRFKDSDFLTRWRAQQATIEKRRYTKQKTSNTGPVQTPAKANYSHKNFNRDWRMDIKHQFGDDPMRGHCGHSMVMAKKVIFLTAGVCRTHELVRGQIVLKQQGSDP